MRVLSVSVLVAASAVVGCAKKSYVQKEVGEVNKKVDGVSAEVEKTQQRVQKSEVRIDEVDKGAKAGISEAKDSAGKATAHVLLQSAMTRDDLHLVRLGRPTLRACVESPAGGWLFA